MTYSFDTLVSEELRAVLAEKRASISERKEIIAGLPTDRLDAVYRLNTYAKMFEGLLKDALRVEVPDKVLILPQYLTDHEPFCLNTAFLVEAASKSGKLTGCEIETLHGYLDRTLLNFLAPDIDKRGIPKEVHEILSKGLDFAPLQPHQLIALSLADVGIPIEKIAIVDKSRKELSAQDLEGQGPVWLIADRHALSLGGERGLNLRQIASTTPGVKLLRLPLENLVEDLALHNLVPPSDGQSPLQLVAERCAVRLARDLCGD